MLTEKELKKLNRYQLLELLIIQTERADHLQKELKDTERKLNEQTVKLSALGSIAEAALQIKGVFDAAQEAADMYVNAAKELADEIKEDARQKSEAILAQALADAREIKGEKQ